MSKKDTNKPDTSEEDAKPVKKRRGTGLVLPKHTLPDTLHLIPVSNRPFFPSQVQPVIFNGNHWKDTLKKVKKTPTKVLGLSYIRGIPGHEVAHQDFPEIGCVVKVHNITNESDNDNDQIQFIALGLQRFKIEKWIRKKVPFLVQVSYPNHEDEDSDTAEVKAYALALIQAIRELVPLNPLYSEELKNYLSHFNPQDPSTLSDFAATITTAQGTELQEILETLPILRRMEKVLTLVRREQEVARLHSEINAEVNRRVSEHQREFFLREQLKVIQKELGISKDDRTADIEEFETRLEPLTVPQAALKKIREELKKLSFLETGSPEFTVCRNYLDWATSVPWGVYSKDKLNLKQAREILDSDHEGLDDVKDQIIEFLAVGAYKKQVAGLIMLLVGPPGVGKTSVGRSIAKTLNRKFYRFSLGGVHDEAEIKGHRRTYIGALPGKLVQALKEVEVANPVIMLDEIDKVGNSYRGDPASALLEVLDPEQNHEFLDHYLDMRIDLSKVLFICTANQVDTIPPALKDRMDIIRLSGYITEEKFAIAKKHLWPRQLEKAGIKKKLLKISDSTLRKTIEDYARESGVRQLEKLLQKIIRKATVKLLNKKTSTINISTKNLHDYLGAPIFVKEQIIHQVGTITGLAWTALGGCTLPVEATVVHHQRAGLKITGNLGDVMKESTEIAYSYIISNAKAFLFDKDFFKDAFIHLHVPEGATPKDGPSAGITIATALLSLARNKAAKKNLAMTGELTLTGKVLAVGGIREKITAAKRQGITTIIIPESCRRSFDELPTYIKNNITMHFAENYRDVWEIALPKLSSSTQTKKRRIKQKK